MTRVRRLLGAMGGITLFMGATLLLGVTETIGGNVAPLSHEVSAGPGAVTAPMGPGGTPSPRQYHFLAFDAESQRSILFGGQETQSTSVFGDTWAYDAVAHSWTKMSPQPRAGSRSGHSMAYDSESDRIVLFSGGIGIFASRDTWAYDVNTDSWEGMAPAGGPPEENGARMAYDAQSDRVIAFGGVRLVDIEFEISNQTWAYDLNTNLWTQMSPPTSPSHRVYHGMAYDNESDRVILFGGDQGLASVTKAMKLGRMTTTTIPGPR